MLAGPEGSLAQKDAPASRSAFAVSYWRLSSYKEESAVGHCGHLGAGKKLRVAL
jgi:hypothetical protein